MVAISVAVTTLAAVILVEAILAEILVEEISKCYGSHNAYPHCLHISVFELSCAKCICPFIRFCLYYHAAVN
ncbi:unnamed protein product [Strongylus vulgaris]|uniref:Secreted protein n=1 Tax=Strongylus vulgaris TaxID=40348 RepID=A0A3P7JHJ5_STRVU|nr:unnamed protein product [Strongylus vulgaris]